MKVTLVAIVIAVVLVAGFMFFSLPQEEPQVQITGNTVNTEEAAFDLLDQELKGFDEFIFSEDEFEELLLLQQ